MYSKLDVLGLLLSVAYLLMWDSSILARLRAVILDLVPKPPKCLFFPPRSFSNYVFSDLWGLTRLESFLADSPIDWAIEPWKNTQLLSVIISMLETFWVLDCEDRVNSVFFPAKRVWHKVMLKPLSLSLGISSRNSTCSNGYPGHMVHCLGTWLHEL